MESGRDQRKSCSHSTPLRTCRMKSRYGHRPAASGKNSQPKSRPIGNHLLVQLSSIPLTKICRSLSVTELVNVSLTCHHWNAAIKGLSVVPGVSSELWDHRIYPKNCPVWKRLIKNIPIDINSFVQAQKLHRGILDKTGKFVERPKVLPRRWNR